MNMIKFMTFAAFAFSFTTCLQQTNCAQELSKNMIPTIKETAMLAPLLPTAFFAASVYTFGRQFLDTTLPKKNQHIVPALCFGAGCASMYELITGRNTTALQAFTLTVLSLEASKYASNRIRSFKNEALRNATNTLQLSLEAAQKELIYAKEKLDQKDIKEAELRTEITKLQKAVQTSKEKKSKSPSPRPYQLKRDDIASLLE